VDFANLGSLLDLVANFYVCMSTKSYTLIPHHLLNYNIQS
jgi:hypothetical protein